jgi:hypothetical protein
MPSTAEAPAPAHRFPAPAEAARPRPLTTLDTIRAGAVLTLAAEKQAAPGENTMRVMAHLVAKMGPCPITAPRLPNAGAEPCATPRLWSGHPSYTPYCRCGFAMGMHKTVRA